MNLTFPLYTTKNNLFTIALEDCKAAAEGYCDDVTDGGGQLVVQRKQDGSVVYNRGYVGSEFWYGFYPILCLILSNQRQWELHIDFINLLMELVFLLKLFSKMVS